MLKRPKNTDSEEEILQMQIAFNKEREKKTFQPAAQVEVKHAKKQSLFAISRKNEQKADYGNGKTSSSNDKTSSHMNIVMGDIVEKYADHSFIADVNELSHDKLENFPKIERTELRKNVDGKSLFALSMERKRHKINPTIDSVEPLVKHIRVESPNESALIVDSNFAQEIHEENLAKLAQMKPDEIMSERDLLLQSMDPKLVKFLAEKQLQKQDTKCKSSLASCQEEVIKTTESTCVSHPNDITDQIETPPLITPVVDILSNNEAENWLNFDVIEKEKLEWMRELPKTIVKLKPNESFEARFDWKGILLPYVEEDTNKDNRDLYLHGDEPFRPGYTLQELFRLARSDIMQQRISAFNSIGGVINIYNQGFYDGIIDLPIGKIFFLLRFGFDENIPAILEVVSKALSLLFYNDNDETLLDFIYESSQGVQQPMLLCCNEISLTENAGSEIEDQLKNLNLTSAPLSAKIEENEEDSKTSMSDYQMAEIDLLQCLIQTNIIQRICYILGTVKPDNSTIISCLKILIRIARTNKDSALQIVSNDHLISVLFENFLPSSIIFDANHSKQLYKFPQYLVLKLFRILMAQHVSLYIKFASLDLFERIKHYLAIREDLNNNFIKVQIESLRVVRTILLISSNSNIFNQLLPTMRYMLEWHNRHMVYDHNGGPSLIRLHAAAVISTIASGSVTFKAKEMLSEALSMCFCRWYFEATKHGINEFSQSILLSSCLDCVAVYTKNTADTNFKIFIEKYLPDFMKSPAFNDFQEGLISSSILLKESSGRESALSSLPNLGSVLLDTNGPKLIFSQKYPIFLVHSLFAIMEQQNDVGDNRLTDCFLSINLMQTMFDYLKKLSTFANKKLALKFLAKSEIQLIFKLLTFARIENFLSQTEILSASYTLLCCITPNNSRMIETIFNKIVFTQNILNYDQDILTKWKNVYLKTFVHPFALNNPSTTVCCPFVQEAILPSDWPYLLLKSLLRTYLQPTSTNLQSNENLDLSERDVILTTLLFTKILEENGIQITSPTEQLMYFMIAFMGPNSDFLEPQMNKVLKEHILLFYKKFKDYNFHFDEVFEGKCKFENLYILFLEHFQAASYGDELFGSLVMIPLANKYNSKYRKMVWSEHASVLRFLNCSEDQLLGQSLEAYLYPYEEDNSLLKSYALALNSKLLRVDTVPFKIATHHVEKAKQKER